MENIVRSEVNYQNVKSLAKYKVVSEVGIRK